LFGQRYFATGHATIVSNTTIEHPTITMRLAIYKYHDCYIGKLIQWYAQQLANWARPRDIRCIKFWPDDTQREETLFGADEYNIVGVDFRPALSVPSLRVGYRSAAAKFAARHRNTIDIRWWVNKSFAAV